MTQLTLAQAQAVIAATLQEARKKSLAPMAVVVLDVRGVLKAFAAEDGTSLRRADIAIGKAHGALALGMGSRRLAAQATERPHFIAAVTHAVGGSLVPVPGGVLVRADDKSIIGVVGASGDTSDNDEAVILAALASVGLAADPG